MKQVTVFLFKDEYYSYLLSGNELILNPLCYRKEKKYLLTDSEVNQILEDYVNPLKDLCNNYPFIEGFMDKALDIKDDLMALIDSLTIYAKRIK